MVNNSTTINRTNNHLSSQILEHRIKDNDMSRRTLVYFCVLFVNI